MKTAPKLLLACVGLVVIVALLIGAQWIAAAPYDQLQSLTDIADFCLKTVSALAVLVGGGWAIYKYIISGSTSWMNNISLDTEVLPYQDNLRLLVIHVRSTNPRTSKFEFDATNATFILDIRRLPDDSNAQTVFSESDGQVIVRIYLIKGTDGYEMLPSATVDDMRTVVVPVGTIVSMTAELRIRRWWQANSDYISTSSVVRI